MSIVYLNGQFLPMEEARISPLDRGFLFGEGVYEVVPAESSRMIGFDQHIARFGRGLSELAIDLGWTKDQWRQLCNELIEKNEAPNLGVYLQVTRGADRKRAHAYPHNLTPTVFGFAFMTPPPLQADAPDSAGFSVVTAEDLRWRRCHIKSTSLLGNVMHHQQGIDAQCKEVILFNERGELTEASSSNVFVVQGDAVITPPLDNQILPGITRDLLLAILRQYSGLKVQERAVTLDELKSAEEVWLTSSSKEVVPVCQIDGVAVGDGRIGPVWREVQKLFSRHKFEC